MTPATTAATQNDDELTQLEDQMASLGGILEEEYARELEKIEAKHEREVRELLRAQAIELKELDQAAQEKKEAKLKEVRAKIQTDKRKNTAIQQNMKIEQGSCKKSGSCPKCDELSSTTNTKRKACGCIAVTLPSLCHGCADKMNLKATICGNWTCNACHDKHVEDCRLCEADEDWLMGY